MSLGANLDVTGLNLFYGAAACDWQAALYLKEAHCRQQFGRCYRAS